MTLPPQTIYSRIGDARLRSTVVMVLFTLFIGGVVYVITLALGGTWAFAVVALVLAALYASGSYYYSDRLVLGISGAREISHEENRELFHIVENLCIGSGLPLPKVYVIDDSAPNAFATGRDPQHASIAVTQGLLDKLDKLQLEGVIAHELSHVRNYDIRLATIAVVLVGLVALLTDLFLRYTWWGAGARRSNEGRGGSAGAAILLLAIILAVLAPIVAKLLQLALSRQREYLADASGALLTRYPEGLAGALEKISADPEPLEVANKATAHLYITNPLKGHESWLNNLFSTHPPIEKRVAALRAM